MATLSGIAFAPIKTKFAGPAQVLPESQEDDIVDEAIGYFRAQCLFKNFEVKGPADKLMIYITVYIQKCLEVIQKDQDQKKAEKNIFTLSIAEVPSPSDTKFFMKDLVKANPKEDGKLQQYLKQIKQEVSKRLLNILFNPEWGTLDLKFWLAYSKKKFLNRAFS